AKFTKPGSVSRDDRRLAPAETIVEPQFDQLDVLIDPEIPGEVERGGGGFEAGGAQTETGCSCAAGERDIPAAEAQIIVLDLGRPIVEQAKFKTDARHPAPAVLIR